MNGPTLVALKTSTVAAAVACTALTSPVVAANPDATSCAKLASTRGFRNTRIDSSREVAANEAAGLPAYCEVTGTITPVQGSRIGVVYRLPDGWNGKMLSLGGGGWAGNVRIEAAVAGLSRGYATAQTDAGHDPGNVWDTSFAANPESLVDFSYRGIHEMTRLGKEIIARFYGHPQARAYFQGCSTGGRQGLMEVQRFPTDYNGVISGAPVYNLLTQTSALLRNQAFGVPGAALSPAQLERLNEASLASCDAQDGLKDGIITDPRKCNFDPVELQCAQSSPSPDCLSPAQVAAVRAVYAGERTAGGWTASYPLSRGGEAGWSRFIVVAPTPGTRPGTGDPGGGLGGLRAVMFGDPGYDLTAFNAERDLKTVRTSAFAGMYEAGNPDIAAFIQQGGKLILWHGFDDPGPSPLGTIEYYEDVQRTTGPKIASLASSVRLFIAPGVYHCRGGPGADQFDALAALDDWIENGHPPERIIAKRQDGRLSRPLCSYPSLPYYKGSGDPNDAGSFECR